MFEYLEKHCADAFKREADQDENVFRSMPFFATALGVQIAILGQISTNLPPLAWSWVAVPLHIMLWVTAALLLATIVFLAFATALRDFSYPSNEPDLVNWAKTERKSYLDQKFDRMEVEALVEEELRERIAEQLAKAAAANRQTNLTRIQHRSRAVFCILASLLLAGLMGATMYATQVFTGPTPDQERGPSKYIPKEAATQKGSDAVQAPSVQGPRDRSDRTEVQRPDNG